MKSRASMPSLQTKARPEGAPTVIVGDEVYLHHDDHGPLSGRVVSVGKDGCTVEHPQHGQLGTPWDKLLGHKARVSRKLTITDRGEDGALALDEDGKVVFVRGQIPDPDDEQKVELAGGELAKALASLPLNPTTDYEPLAKAITHLGAAWTDHIRQTGERLESAQIRQEANDVERARILSDLSKAFLAAVQSLHDAHSAERGAWLAALERVARGGEPGEPAQVAAAPASAGPNA